MGRSRGTGLCEDAREIASLTMLLRKKKPALIARKSKSLISRFVVVSSHLPQILHLLIPKKCGSLTCNIECQHGALTSTHLKAASRPLLLRRNTSAWGWESNDAGSEEFVERMPGGSPCPNARKAAIAHCPRCRSPLKMFKVSGRTAYCCPHCQF